MTYAPATIAEINGSDPDALDALPFGVSGLNEERTVEIHNKTESRLADLDADTVLGRHFFTAVAPCMNTFIVAEGFEEETDLDETIDYILTVRMRPTSVKLRMLKGSGVTRRCLFVQYQTA